MIAREVLFVNTKQFHFIVTLPHCTASAVWITLGSPTRPSNVAAVL